MADEKTGAERVYPAAPLEMAITNEQKQGLLSPPSYDQAIAAGDATITGASSGATPMTGGTSVPAATSGPGGNVSVVILPQQNLYGPIATDVLCPYCHNSTRTRLRYEPNSRTHTIAFLLCLFQLYCCICIPYCIPSCMNANHYCGMCDRFLGTYISR